MGKVFIYGLYTSGDETIRYIGKCNDTNQRLKMHYSQRNSSKTHKNNWICKVISNGEEICIKVLEEVDESEWIEKEKEWIKNTKNLTNTSSGGLGGSGKRYNVSYDMCKSIVSRFNIKSKSEWIKFTKLETFPINIPKNPRNFFKDNWVSWGDFLQTKREADVKISNHYIDYNSSKEWVSKNLKIGSSAEWSLSKNKIPSYIPKRPERFYKKRGWLGWPDFLGKKRIANRLRKILDYNDAKNLINKLGIKSIKQYKSVQSSTYINELPVHPHLTYKNKGFKSYEEFFRRLQ
jgi:hypothetical protein